MEQANNTVCEAELHAAWQAGDRYAAAKLIGEHLPRLRQLGERLGLSAVDADDLTQQVLLEAFRSPYQARPGVSYYHWLSTIARRHSIRIMVRQRRAASVPVRRPTSPRTGAWRGQLVARIEAMPEPLSDVFARLFVGYTRAEICEELVITPEALRMRIHRGRRWLCTQEQ